ncbi:thioesterase-like superfamily-domain-containing protein [Hyaloraphidium curvatum]|nr:thioesterase-like superfamily-domain-containing protein [Hyaloraphidium curvatum]
MTVPLAGGTRGLRAFDFRTLYASHRSLHRRARPRTMPDPDPSQHPFETALTMAFSPNEPPPHMHGHHVSRFRGPFAPTWINLAGTAHGGILLAQGLRAARRHVERTVALAEGVEPDSKPEIISMHGSFMAPILPALGEVSYDVGTVKTSKRFAWVDSRIGQIQKNGHMRHGIHLTCCFSLPNPPPADPDDPLNPDNLPEETCSGLLPPTRDEIPDPDNCVDQTETMRAAGFVRSPGFHTHREMRVSPKLADRVKAIVEGRDDGKERRIDVSTLAWCRFSPERAQDAESAAFFSDAVIPLNLSLALSTVGSRSYRPDVFYSWSTVGLTAEFFGPPLKQLDGEAGKGNWLLVRSDLQHTSHGRAELEMVLWDVEVGGEERTGRVVAVCRQQGVIVTRKREVDAGHFSSAASRPQFLRRLE